MCATLSVLGWPCAVGTSTLWYIYTSPLDMHKNVLACIPGLAVKTLPVFEELVLNAQIRKWKRLKTHLQPFIQTPFSLHLPPWWAWCWECPGHSTPGLWQCVLSSWQTQWTQQPGCCVGGWFAPHRSASQHKTLWTCAQWVGVMVRQTIYVPKTHLPLILPPLLKLHLFNNYF